MINNGLKTCNSEEWATPQDFFDRLNEEFNFTLDPCSTDENCKCEKHYTKEQDGLKQDWTGETVFCNPPYGKEIWKWCRKCYEHSLNGGTAVMLIHARTDTAWFHDFVYGKAEMRFIRGRLHFNGSKWSAPFPSLVAIYSPTVRMAKEKRIKELENQVYDLEKENAFLRTQISKNKQYITYTHT